MDGQVLHWYLNQAQKIQNLEGEIAVRADTREKAEDQGYDLLAHLGQITVVAFKKEEEQMKQDHVSTRNSQPKRLSMLRTEPRALPVGIYT